MLKFLVAIDHTIESSFALRFACRVSRGREVHMEALHVLEPSSRTMEYGSGWAIHTRKNEQAKLAYNDMAGIIASEAESCETIPGLKVVHGNAVKEIAREAREGGADLLFMGSVHDLEGRGQGILLKVLAKAPCPLVVIKHYRPLRKALLCLGPGESAEKAVAKTALLLAEAEVVIELMDTGSGEGPLAHAKEVLTGSGLDVRPGSQANAPTGDLVQAAHDYDLVIVGLPESRKPDPLVMKLLAALPAPVMLCP